MKGVNPGTVALIAHGMIQTSVKFGDLDSTDFSTYTIPGTNGKRYIDRTMETAVKGAWDLIKKAEEMRPQD